jgi:predicted DNA-binding transcriptional regulator AlpA
VDDRSSCQATGTHTTRSRERASHGGRNLVMVRGAGIRTTSPAEATAEPRRGLAGLSAPLLLDERAAAAAFGVSEATFGRLRNEPWMPAPITLGKRLLRWSVDELQAAIAAMPRQAEPAPMPLALVKAQAKRAGRTEVTT